MTLRRLAQDTTWMLVERAVRMTLGFFVGLYCARLLGPGAYGLYGYALSIVTLFAFLGQAGLESLLVRELVSADRPEASTLRNALALRAAGGLLGGCLAVLLAYATQQSGLDAVPLVALLAAGGLVQSTWVIDSWLHAHRRFQASAMARMTAIVIAAGAKLWAVTSSEPLLALAAISIAEALLTAAALIVVSRHSGFELTSLFGVVDPGSLKELWVRSRPLLYASFAIAIYARIDMVMLGMMRGSEEAGLYAAAAALSEAFYAIPLAIMAAAAPRLSAAYVRSVAEFSRHIANLLRLLSLAGLAIALAITVLAPTVIHMTYGAEFAGAAAILAIHIWSTWFVFVSSASEPWYINHGLFNRYLAKTTLAALTNVTLNLLLIPSYGGPGAAAATVASYALSAVACNILWRDTRDLFRVQAHAMLGFAPRWPAAR